MDSDKETELQADTVAPTESSAPGSPIAIDIVPPDESIDGESSQDSDDSEEDEQEVEAVTDDVANDPPAPIQSDNNTKQEAETVEPIPTPHPDAIEVDQPPTDANADTKPDAVPTSTAPKPKSRAQKARSPSPPSLPPPPPPALTVRLTLELGGPSNYSVNILELARETGQRHPTPPPIKRDSDSDGSDDDDEHEHADPPAPAQPATDGEAPPKKRRTRKKRQELDDYYDVHDPFIDDSELRVDAPTHFAQTKQKGFYVNSGDVTLVLDEPEPVAKKPRKRRAFVPEMPSFLAGKGRASDVKPVSHTVATPPLSKNGIELPIVTSNHDPNVAPLSITTPSREQIDRRRSSGSIPLTVGEGTRDSPIALLDDGDERSNNAKRMKMSNGDSLGVPGNLHAALSAVKLESTDGSRKRKISNILPGQQFSSELMHEFTKLRKLVEAADFTLKSKFPPQLRAPLAQVAVKAIELEEYGEAFFKYLPDVFPYNKFTMTKLVKRLVFDKHTEILNRRMDVLVDELRDVVNAGFPAAQQAYKEDVAKWEEKQEKKKQSKPDEEGAPTPSTAFVNANDGNPETSVSTNRARGDAPPQQRYKLTDEIKNLIWQLVTINNEMAAMTNVMHEWEPDNHHAVSDQSMRKNLYQRIVGVFPEGWINTGLISREFSNMKRKVQLAGEEQTSE